MRGEDPIVVVYDGLCQLCKNSMKSIYRHFGDSVTGVDFRKVDALETIHSGLTFDACQARLHVVDHGELYAGARAFVQILRLHPVWKYVTPLYFVPPVGFVAERIYNFVAAHRLQFSKLLGRNTPCGDSCQVHRTRKR